jgi:hypothetical protein
MGSAMARGGGARGGVGRAHGALPLFSAAPKPAHFVDGSINRALGRKPHGLVLL